MRCSYCFYTDEAEHREVACYGMMSEELLEELVRKVFLFADGICTFGFQGGEPTLIGLAFYKRLIELQKRYNTRGITVNNTIQTNGYAITGEFASFLAENNFLVGVSMDATREMHDALRRDIHGNGTYDRIMETIGLFNVAGVQYNILCVVNGVTARSPGTVYNALKQYGFLQFIPCIAPIGGQQEQYALNPTFYAKFLKSTFDLYRKDFWRGRPVSIRNFDNYIGMLAGHPPENCAMRGSCSLNYVIEADGGVYPCDFYALDEWRLGNIGNDSFFRLEKSKKAGEFIDSSCQRVQECLDCRYGFICRGGCRRDKLTSSDGYLGPSKWCQSYQEFFDYALDDMREMAKAIRNSSRRIAKTHQ